MEKKRVAVIGAGSSGLCNIKCCLEEGLDPLCFESSDDIGGLWRFKENPEEGRASIYKSLIINTSKEMMCFSDFPIPDDFPNYMHNSKIMDYFRLYAKHFQLLKYIRFKTKVCSVTKCSDFSTSGQWEVTTESDGKRESSIFDAVLVCTGHHVTAHLPLDSIPGISTFKGRYLHSRDYKSPDAFTGKRVVVIGVGNSGVDLAVEISHTAQQVFLSTRRGAWVLGRVGDKGYPLDTVLSSRARLFLKQCLPSSLIKLLSQYKLNSRFDHAHYGLRPKHGVYSQHPTINDNLPNCILSGKIVIKSNVAAFTDTAALFEDGSKEEDIDCVVLATGYSFSFPFLGDLVRVVENQISLYKFVFSPTLEKPTLAIVGLVQPLGAIMPIAEMQARWATRVFKGLAELPPASEMMSDISVKRFSMAKRYVKSQRHTIQVDYVDYMDELASLIGVKPNLWSRFVTDPKLALELFWGPCTPYQYRLQGPGKWEGARKAILTQHERILKPLRTRPVAQPDDSASVPFWFKLAGLLVLLAAIWAYF
ncbi:flavin-containing monooxygenase 5-like isoform 1-T2 [Vipera latastei]